VNGVETLLLAAAVIIGLAGTAVAASGAAVLAAEVPARTTVAAAPEGVRPAIGPDEAPDPAAGTHEPSRADGTAPPVLAAPAAPAALAVDAVGIRTPLLDLGTDEHGALEVPDDAGIAGWWRDGGRPGQPGTPLVLTGHVDSRRGPGVFARLDAVRPGERVVVADERGREHAYRVTHVTRHTKDAFPTLDVYGATERPELRLITCGGTFDRGARSYTDNIIVHALLEGSPEAR
jgi:hypothetical protein